MKKTNIILSFVICILLYGCTDLSETVYTGVAMNDFFKNEKELVANAGRAYTKLQGYNSEQSLWTLLLQASDECAYKEVRRFTLFKKQCAKRRSQCQRIETAQYGRSGNSQRKLLIQLT